MHFDIKSLTLHRDDAMLSASIPSQSLSPPMIGAAYYAPRYRGVCIVQCEAFVYVDQYSQLVTGVRGELKSVILEWASIVYVASGGERKSRAYLGGPVLRFRHTTLTKRREMVRRERLITSIVILDDVDVLRLSFPYHEVVSREGIIDDPFNEFCHRTKGYVPPIRPGLSKLAD
jgi:hypothetical protein